MTDNDGDPLGTALREHGPVITLLPRVTGLSTEHAREWRHFARWASMGDRAVLPTDTSTVLAYLAAFPNTATTRRARLTALNAAHHLSGKPIPGHAESVRQAINPGRAQRLAAARVRVDELLPEIPRTGWTAGLFGRRDAAILVLAAAGLGFDQIAALDQHDIRIHDDRAVVGPQPLVELHATGDPATCPVAILRHWSELVAVAAQATGPYHLERILTEQPGTSPLRPAHYDRLPYITGFDAYGNPNDVPDTLDRLTGATLDALAAARLENAKIAARVRTAVDLDDSYLERGLAARARDREATADIEDLLARLDEKIDAALQRSADLLSPHPEPSAPTTESHP